MKVSVPAGSGVQDIYDALDGLLQGPCDGYGILKGKCSLYLSLEDGAGERCPANEQEFVYGERGIEDVRLADERKAREAGMERLLAAVKDEASRIERYDKKTEQARRNVSLGVERGWSTVDKWRKRLADLQDGRRAVEEESEWWIACLVSLQDTGLDPDLVYLKAIDDGDGEENRPSGWTRPRSAKFGFACVLEFDGKWLRFDARGIEVSEEPFSDERVVPLVLHV